MKSALAAVLFLTFSIAISGQETSQLSTPPNGDNEHAEVSQWIGPVKISIDYHSPKVHNPDNNDRTGHIWGELVHYGIVDEGFGPTKGAPWRAGANESTSITFSNDVKVEGKDLKAGTYALFLDVEKNGSWQWIFSNHLGWGGFQYDPQDETLRVPVTPEDAPMGRESEADTVMQKALHLPGTDAYSVYAFGMGLLRKDKKDKAMNAFIFNQQQHPQDKFWTSLGLARGYTALGDKKNAIANWEIVLQNVPANLSNRTATYEAALKKLREAS